MWRESPQWDLCSDTWHCMSLVLLDKQNFLSPLLFSHPLWYRYLSPHGVRADPASGFWTRHFLKWSEMWWLVVENNYRGGGAPYVDGLSDVTVGSMRCSFNIQQARLQWQLHKACEAASCWSANISSEPLYGSLPATKCLYLQSACHFPLAGELVYYLAHVYLGKTFQFKSAGTTVALARRFPRGSKG